MTTRTYVFNVTRGPSQCVLVVSSDCLLGAEQKVALIEPKHARIHFDHSVRGTLEDFLGDVAMKRIVQKYLANRKGPQRKLDMARLRSIERQEQHQRSK